MAFRVLASLSILWRLRSKDFATKLPKTTSNTPALKPKLYKNQLACSSITREYLSYLSKIAGTASYNISSNTQKHSTNTTINSILSHRTFPNAKSLCALAPSSLGFLFRYKRVAKNSKQAQSKTTQSNPPYTDGPPRISSRNQKLRNIPSCINDSIPIIEVIKNTTFKLFILSYYWNNLRYNGL